MKKILIALTFFQLTFYTTFVIPSRALADMPNSDDLKSAIQNEASSQTSTVNADTSEATQTSVANTGDNANANNDSSSTSNTGVNNSNTSEISQTINAEANTGNNEASGNISINGGGAGLISTGDASVNTVGGVNAGSNTTGISGSGRSGGVNSNTANTGNNLSSTSNSTSASTTLVNNGNTTTINQVANVSANTGNNRADGNIALGGGAAGVITTGNAFTSTSFLVTAGGNVTLIGGNGGNGPGDGASIVLANAGHWGTFNTTSNTRHYTVITNENRALLSQTCGYAIRPEQYVVDMSGCVANTGGNTANGNIGMGADAGVINTGDAVVDVSMSATVNQNQTGIEGAGSGASTNSDVVNTGDHVNVNTSANASDTTQVNNKNRARVDQSVDAYANTGNNTANGNISFGGRAGVINTGDATVNVSMSADVNSSDTLIAQSADEPDSAVTTVINTGDDVNVSNSTTSTENTQVNNFNLLELVQRVISWVNTGGNTADGNIGGAAGIITTGDATSTTNMNVDANHNCTLIGVVLDVCPQAAISDPAPETPGPTAGPIGGPTSEGSAQIKGEQTVTVSAAARDNNPASGQVLGAAVLPATGPQDGLLLATASLIFLAFGLKLRKYEVSRMAVNN